ncbi:MAG: mechanosensitive ion channel [Promethearchaeota archaeon]|nr:MAG: mechanosensitive ion channel [Candidatus Lokiarchaeota archaeon]
MKKQYQLIIGIILLALVIWIIINFSIDPLLVVLIFINIIVYLGKTIVLQISNQVIERRTVRYLVSLTVNIIWLVFLFQLIFYAEFFFTGYSVFSIAIISFLIVAVSFTLKDRINNIISGVMILTTEGFEVGDLIETNGVKGIVTELTLNYTKIRDFHGIITYLPNDKVFNAPVKKYTFKEINLTEETGEEQSGLNFMKKYVGKFGEILARSKKIARFVQVVELLPVVNPEELDTLLGGVFDKYEPIFGIRPFYYANTSVVDRFSITIQMLAEKPKLLLLFAHRFLRDVLYKLYHNGVFLDWQGATENQSTLPMEGGM